MPASVNARDHMHEFISSCFEVPVKMFIPMTNKHTHTHTHTHMQTQLLVNNEFSDSGPQSINFLGTNMKKRDCKQNDRNCHFFIVVLFREKLRQLS